MVGGLELRGRDHPQLGVQPLAVEPVDVVRGGMLHLLEASPWTILVDQLRLVGAAQDSAGALSYESPLEPTEATHPPPPAAPCIGC